jgi:hypothetical protein
MPLVVSLLGMFAKKQDVAVRTDAVIKGKDVKQFRAQLAAALGVDEEALASVVSSKVLHRSRCKFPHTLSPCLDVLSPLAAASS